MASETEVKTHTPGPWTTRRQQIVGMYGEVVARVTDNEDSGFDCPTPEIAKVNAGLIAAAPYMLEALKAALDGIDVYLGATANVTGIEPQRKALAQAGNKIEAAITAAETTS